MGGIGSGDIMDEVNLRSWSLKFCCPRFFAARARGSIVAYVIDPKLQCKSVWFGST